MPVMPYFGAGIDLAKQIGSCRHTDDRPDNQKLPVLKVIHFRALHPHNLRSYSVYDSFSKLFFAHSLSYLTSNENEKLAKIT
jgi:hypothetical protein